MAIADTRAFLLGLEGVALLRCLTDGASGDYLDARLAEVRALLDVDLGGYGQRLPLGSTTTTRGYDVWAATYDDGTNPLLGAEQPTVEALLEGLPPGRALDAACGTGRISRLLEARGHDVVGVDGSSGMLQVAAAAGRAPLLRADLTQLPFPDASFDLVTCCLALTHAPGLTEPLVELARVLRPGGHLLTSDIHVASMHLGGVVTVEVDGDFRALPSSKYLASDYLKAAWAAGLVPVRCEEPRWGPVEGEGGPPAAELCPEAAAAAYRDTPSIIAWLFRSPG